MISFFLCFVVPTLVFGSNNANANITLNEENPQLVSRNITNEENVLTDLQDTTITDQVQQNDTTTTTTNKTERLMEWVPLETQKKSENPLLKKKNLVKPKRSKAEKKMIRVKPRIQIKQDMSDMPLKSDLDEFLSSLHKMIDFFLENKNDVDIALFYGIFLLDVNLNKVFKEKHSGLPSTTSFSLKHLLEKNGYLVKFFTKMVDQDFNPDDELVKNIASLFNNEPLWMKNLQPFDGTHVNDTVDVDFEVLQARYSFWEKYLSNVRDFNQAEPNPGQSDRCLGFLAKNPVHKTPWRKYCQIPTFCRISLEKGTNFGYGLTHRLLYLQLAYYGQRCHVFSNAKDKELRENFCKHLYDEASYISMNDYLAIDLFVEQLCLCSLDGHYEFLRRSWLLGILSFQTSSGCFSDKMLNGRAPPSENEPHMWRLDKGQNQYILDGQCNIHTSAAAAATLGFGVKFILEAFY